MLHLRNLIAAVLLLLVFSGFALAQEKVELHLKFVKGDVHHVNVTVNQTIDQTVREVAQQTKQTIVVGYSLTVADVNDTGTTTISVRYESVLLRAPNTAAGPVEYDSANPPGQVPEMASALAALVGQQYSFTIDRTGKVTQVNGIQKLLENVLGHLNIPAGATRMAAEKVLRQQLSEAELKLNLENLFAPLPDHAVGIGDSWSHASRTNLGFPMSIQSTYTLQGREDGIAIIEVTGSAGTLADPSMTLGTIKMNYELKGEQSGSIRVFETTGWIKAAEMSQHLNGSATLRGPNVDPQTVPVTIDSKIKVEQK